MLGLWYYSFTLYCRIVLLIAFLLLQVVDLGLAKSPNDAGNYAGYIASAMMFGRFLSRLVRLHIRRHAGLISVNLCVVCIGGRRLTELAESL